MDITQAVSVVKATTGRMGEGLAVGPRKPPLDSLCCVKGGQPQSW